MLAPLRTHGWTVSVTRESPDGLILEAERGGHHHKIALIYSSATDNRVYKQLAEQVEHIYFNGPPNQVEQFTQNVSVPVSSADDFNFEVFEWNSSSADGKFAPSDSNADLLSPSRPDCRILLTEEPIKAVWLRLRQLQSVTLARKLISERCQQDGVALNQEQITRKAEGISYSIRNAYDYFLTHEASPVSQRVLNLYYGSLAFGFAEMLAAPTGSQTLEEIEASTKLGHGLYTIDGVDNGLGSLVVGVIASGFFPAWMRSMGLATASLPSKKPRKYTDLHTMPSEAWLTIEGLLSRIPEVSDLFTAIFESKPSWIAPHYDVLANRAGGLYSKQSLPIKTYANFVDESGRLTKEDVAEFPGPLSEISPQESEGSQHIFRVAISHPGSPFWWSALPLHQSPFVRASIIKPIFGSVNPYRAMCVVLLYALSIIVRYRPSIWRRVQEGDLDHMKILIEAFLAAVERILPQEFLEKISGQKFIVSEPGSLF